MSSQRQSEEKTAGDLLVLRDFHAVRGATKARRAVVRATAASQPVEIPALALREGELCAIVGPNGAGKSTLLLALAGLLSYRGSAHLGAFELSSLSPGERAKRVSFLGASEELAFAYTVRQVVLFARAPHQDARLAERPEDARAVDAALRAWDLTAFAARPATELSAGETRRVELASIFAQATKLMLLDEPMTALDFRQSAFAHERLLAHVRETGATCLFSTHDLQQARAFATRAIVIAKGRILEDGPAADVLREDRLLSYFE